MDVLAYILGMRGDFKKKQLKCCGLNSPHSFTSYHLMQYIPSDSHNSVGFCFLSSQCKQQSVCVFRCLSAYGGRT